MTLQKFNKLIFKIENILMFIAVIVFSITVYLKSLSSRNFFAVYRDFNSFQMNIQNIILYDSPQQKKEIIENLQKQMHPYTLYDSELEARLNTIFNLITRGQYSREISILLQDTMMSFSVNLLEKQSKVDFAYDCYMYSAIFLGAIALLVMLNNSFSQKNQILKQVTINDSQLKISRDLHDGVAQDLYAIKIYLQKKDVNKADFYATQALNEVRYLIDSMHLDLSKDLLNVIEQTLNAFESNYGIKTRLYIGSDNLNSLNTNTSLELLKILQEALSNIARHSDASEVTIKFTEIGNDLKVIISDNGKGFNAQDVEIKKKNDQKKHYGITNIKERVSALGGTVEFINKGGTTIAILLKDIIH